MRKKNISFIGGDLITAHLINMFLENYNIKTYAFEGAYDLIKAKDNVKEKMFSKTAEEAINFSEIIVLAMPFKNQSEQIVSTFSNITLEVKEILPYLKKKTVFAGNLSDETLKELYDNENIIHNISANNEVKIANAIIASEAAVQIIGNELETTIKNTKILILGFGRLGKMLCKTFSALDADIVCEARKNSDIVWIEALGYKSLHLNNLKENINEFDVIINTVPFEILNEEVLKNVKKDVFILDLADDIRGINVGYAREKGIKNVWALSLPQKNAPISYAKAIRDVMELLINE